MRYMKQKSQTTAGHSTSGEDVYRVTVYPRTGLNASLLWVKYYKTTRRVKVTIELTDTNARIRNIPGVSFGL